MLGDPLYNSCCACGTTFLPLRACRILSEDGVRCEGSGSPVSLAWGFICSLIDFDKILFADRLAWGSFIRLIMIIPGQLFDTDKDQYKLSGIGLTPGASIFEVPPHRDQLFVGDLEDHRPRPAQLMGVFPARWHGPDSIYPYGYPIHARCWNLIEKLLGCDAEKDLECLARVLQNMSMDSSFKTYGHPHVTAEHVEPWTTSGIGFYDPVKIPALRKVIDESIGRRHGDELNGKTGNPSLNIFQDVKHTPGPHNLPLDIQWLILDLLEYTDIPHLLRAFGWMLPDFYWARRLPKSLIFELGDLNKDISEFDWQFLCLGVEKLLRTSPEMLNRQRLFPVLDKTIELFREEVARKDKCESIIEGQPL